MQRSSLKGFILTRRRCEVAGDTVIEFWLSTDSGPIRAFTQTQKPVFFIRQEDSSKAKNLIFKHRVQADIKPLQLKTFDQEPVSGVYFSRHNAVFKIKDSLHAEGILTFEDDVRLTERFLMERFVYGNAEINGIFEKHPTHKHVEIHRAEVSPTEYSPNFHVISLDIECSEKGELYSIGLASSKFQQVIMIGPNVDAPDWITWVADERSLLVTFIKTIQEQDPDIFIGWSVVNFDFRLLIERALTLNLPLNIGRGGEIITWRDNPSENNQGYVTIPGRVIIDGIDALKTATYQFDSFSLETVAQQLLGKGKAIENVENRLHAIKHDFKHNKVKLARYNLQDCTLVLEIFDKTNLLAFLTLRSQLTGLELDRSGGSVAAFLNLYLPKLHRAGYISPNRPKDGGLASPGGYVMDSQPGLYRHVLVLDFKSLYPSIIRTFKIDPLGLIEGLKHPHTAIPGFRGAAFSRDKHFLPDIITSLWQQRDIAKQQKDAAKSQALKILMNSFYGVLGSGGCPLYDTRLASSITMRGHDLMQTTAKWIESFGYQVIYGDTDSTFVWLNGEYSEEETLAIGKKLQDYINQRWTETIKNEFQLESYLEIEFESHYDKFLMPTIRGSDRGSKKRYAGLVRDGEKYQLIFKGLENVRSDWTAMAKDFQFTLYNLVFHDQDVRDYISNTIHELKEGKLDEKLVYRKRLRRKLEQYTKNIPPHVKAARNADEKNKALNKPLQYQYKGWIAYVITLDGPQTIDYQSSMIDYEHYIEKQIRPIAEGILPFINLSFDELTQPQMKLL